MIKIGIIDDQMIIRQGLRGLLYSDEIEILGEARCGRTALELINETTLDVVLVDTSLPDIDVFTLKDLLVRRVPNVKVIVLVEAAHVETLRRLVLTGVHGILSKESTFDLISAIKAVHAGQNYCQPDLAHKLIGYQREELMVLLSDREFHVLDSYLRNEKTTCIAEKYRMNTKTVLNIKHRALTKLNTSLERLRDLWFKK